MSHQSQVRANTLRGFGQFMAKRGIATDPLLQEAGIAADDLTDDGTDLPFNHVAQLMEVASKACGDPNFGLSFAKEYPVGGMGLLAFLVLNSRTVEDAMRTFVRFVPLIKTPFKYSFVDGFEGASICWRLVDDVSHGYKQIYLFGASLLILRLRQLAHPNWIPKLVELQVSPLHPTADVQNILGPNVVYNAPHYAVHVDQATLRREVPQATPELRTLLERYGEKDLAGVFPTEEKLIATVRSTILDIMGHRRISLDAVARDMNCSARALQSRLAAIGASYEELLNEARKIRAEQLLKQPRGTMTDIALQLGFSELSAFTRAAQRWFGRPPSAQRRYYQKAH